MAFSMSIGSLDITHYIAVDGFKWERNDIDSPNSGRDASGTMRRKVIARKDKVEVTCRPLTRAELNNLITALNHETVTASYVIPGDTSAYTSTFYNSQRGAGVSIDNGTQQIYSDVKFNLIEV